jgi:hypothetical protein
MGNASALGPRHTREAFIQGRVELPSEMQIISEAQEIDFNG